MQYEQPQYSDGIVKNRQQRFGGLNHNPGAGDGQLYEMHNMGSDYFPLLSTRLKRRKYKQLTKCNGIFAAGKLCWVDGTEFYYDGMKKGDVADCRKTFAAINDMILIFPDNKYYNIADDSFGRLSSVYDAANLPGRAEVSFLHGAARDTIISGSQETVIRQGGTYVGERFEKSYLFTGNSIRAEDGSTDWMQGLSEGSTVAIVTDDAALVTGDETVFTVRGTDPETGSVLFDTGSFYVREGRTVREDAEIWKVSLFEAEFAADTEDSEGRASLFRFRNYLSWWLPASIRAQMNVRISGSSIEENNGTFPTQGLVTINGITYLKTEKDSFAAGVSTADSAYRVSVAVPGDEEIQWKDTGETSRQITLLNADWQRKGFRRGSRIRISGSASERRNGVFEITANGGEGVARIADTITIRTVSDGSIETVTESGGGVKFELLNPPIVFSAVEAEGQDQGVNTITMEGARWSYYFDVGEDLQISGSSIAENNGYFRILEIDDSTNSMRFAANSFTAGIDTDFGTVMKVQRPGILEFKDGTLYGTAASANTIRVRGIDWSEYFNAGDAVEISGSSEEHNNQSIIVREVDGEELRFYENSFVNCMDTAGTVVVKRPGAQAMTAAFECENRIWGFKDKTIYASKLGDPFNFNAYDGLETDSWTIDLGSFEIVTGGIDYQGYPTFMTDGALFKVYGSVPSNFELIKTAATGCAPGSEGSLAIAGETLFWMHRNGICAYAGGVPTMINAAFGNERYRNAVAGSDGEKYYVSTEDENGVWHLFVYDVRRGMWHEEDNTQVLGFAYHDGNLYYADSEGNIMLTGNVKFHPEDSAEEKNFDWWVEFTDFVDDSPNKKGINKFQIRMELDEDETDPPSVTVKLMCDSDGTWIIPEGGTIEDPEKRSYILPIIPRRADHYKLRIEGHGGCRIYSIAKEYYQGSDFKSQPGRH